MLVLLNLDIFAYFLAAWHANIEPEYSSKSSMLAMAANTRNNNRNIKYTCTIIKFPYVTRCPFRFQIKFPFVSGGSANLPRCWNRFSPTRSKGCPFRFQVGFQVGLFRAALQIYHAVEIIFHLPSKGWPFSFQVGFQVGLFRAALQTYHTVEIDFHLLGPRGALRRYMFIGEQVISSVDSWTAWTFSHWHMGVSKNGRDP